MKTNCELPLSMMLSDNYQLNDYDFVLFHLYKTNPIYRDYYRAMRTVHPNRLMILDNSAYEFFIKGEKLRLDEFADAINELAPDYYILPDVLMDQEATLSGIEEFEHEFGFEFDGHHGHYPKPLAVVQGKTSEELIECFKIYKKIGIDYVGVPFHLSFYKEYPIYSNIAHIFHKAGYDVDSEDVRYAMGRVAWTKDNEDILKSFSKVHFLGSHCPLEKTFYGQYYTMDTGYPVKLGIEGTELGKEYAKPWTIIDDFLDKPLDDFMKQMIRHNILKFKAY